MSAGPRRGAHLVAGAIGAIVVGAVLWWTGRAVPGPDSYDQAGFSDWLVTTDPVVAAFAVVRLAGLVLVAWAVLSGSLAVVVHAGPLRHRRRLTRIVDRLCLPVVRRMVHAGLGVAMTAATFGPGVTAASATTHAAPVGVAVETATLVALDPPTTATVDTTAPDRPPEPHPADAPRARITALDDPTASSTAPLPSSAATTTPDATDRPGRNAASGTTAEPEAVDATWSIEPGQHLWHVAATTLAAHLDHPPDDAQVAAYLALLVEANRSRLAVPDDPDLVFAGQVMVLPAPTPASPS